MTLRACIDMIRVENNMRGHKFSVRGAKGAVRTYLELHQKPADPEEVAIRTFHNLLLAWAHV